MRTKTLLLTAALTAAGALTSMAQVYSVNIVGYVNLTIPAGFSLVANQLDNQPDNKVSTLFPAPPAGTVFYKYNGGFSAEQFTGAWPPSGSATDLNPGEGVFIFNPSTAFTATFVGQVRTGSTTLPVPEGFAIVSSIIPQAGNLYDPTTPNNDLGYNTPGLGEVIYQYHSGYSASQWTGSSGTPASGPTLAVGEAFFNFSPGGTGTHNWNRTFNVGP